MSKLSELKQCLLCRGTGNTYTAKGASMSKPSQFSKAYSRELAYAERHIRALAEMTDPWAPSNDNPSKVAMLSAQYAASQQLMSAALACLWWSRELVEGKPTDGSYASAITGAVAPARGVETLLGAGPKQLEE